MVQVFFLQMASVMPGGSVCTAMLVVEAGVSPRLRTCLFHLCDTRAQQKDCAMYLAAMCDGAGCWMLVLLI